MFIQHILIKGSMGSNKKLPSTMEPIILSEELGDTQQMTLDYVRNDKCYEEKK